MTVSAPLKVIRGSNYLSQQATRLKRIVGFLEPLSNALIAISLVGFLGVFFLINNNSYDLLPILISILAICALGGLGLPRANDSLKIEANNYASGLAGEERLAAVLSEHLDDSWSLYQNLLLPDGRGDIDAVLVGPRGVYVLEVKHYSNTHRNHGLDWQRRANKTWEPIQSNPSRQAQNNAKRLARFFGKQSIDASVATRVVWASDSALVIEEPAVQIWQLNHASAIQDDIKGGNVVEKAALEKANMTLLQLSAESTDA